MQSCIEFISDFLTYLPLNDPLHFPDLLPSPTTTIQLRAGDCLDFATLSCSLLRGSGYNAYVVTGYAPKWITTADQSNVECPWLGVQEAAEIAKKKAATEAKEKEERAKNKYIILARPEHKSKYIEAREKEKKAAEDAAAAEAEYKLKYRQPIIDPLDGERVHAWILICKGRRDVTEDVFIEPTTGTIYPVNQCPYTGVDSVWNEVNYWANVQTQPIEVNKNIV
jgi:hypothetical protein